MTEQKQEYAIVKKDNTVIQNFHDVENVAKAMAGSGFFQDSKQASQAIVKVLAGHELGFGPFASMTGIHIIQGKPAFGANLIAGAIKAQGKYDYRIAALDDTRCDVEFYQIIDGKRVSLGMSSFSIDDAKKAGLTTKDNWSKFPRNMLFSRAISNGARWYTPDVFSGAPVYTPEELGADVDQDGNVVDAPFIEVEPEPQPKKAEPELDLTPVPVEDAPKMSLELAETETNSKGEKYSDIDTDKLTHMFNAMNKLATKTEDHVRKMEAIKTILQARSA